MKQTQLIFDLSDQSCIRWANRFRSKESFVKSFRGKYKFIIAYHGTNINGIDSISIKSEGLKCATSELLKQWAINRFILPFDDLNTKNKVLQIIESRSRSEKSITIGKIYFTLASEELQDRAYHYLLFGPESLFPVADYLRQSLGLNFRERMMNYGDPSIIKVHIPTPKTTDIDIEGIYEYLNCGASECCLVYEENLAHEYILEINQVPKPADRNDFLWI